MRNVEGFKFIRKEYQPGQRIPPMGLPVRMLFETGNNKENGGAAANEPDKAKDLVVVKGTEKSN